MDISKREHILWEVPVREMARYVKAMQARERADLEFGYWQTSMLVKAFTGADLPPLPSPSAGREDCETTMTERLMEQYREAGLMKEDLPQNDEEITPPSPS